MKIVVVYKKGDSMEELLEKIKTEIEAIKEEEVKLEELTEKSNKLGEEEEQLKKERDAISDTNSGFYQDAKEQVEKNMKNLLTLIILECIKKMKSRI